MGAVAEEAENTGGTMKDYAQSTVESALDIAQNARDALAETANDWAQSKKGFCLEDGQECSRDNH